MGERRGLVEVYTGEGKGKTTAALGLALRAEGQGLKVKIIQFLKKRESGEVKAIKKTQIGIEQYGTEDFINPKKLRPIDFEEAKKGLEKAKIEIRSGKWDLLILDEINVAVKFGLIKLAEVLDLIENKPKNLELVLTGRWASPEISKKADLVTEMKERKHIFKRGIKGRKGIDY